MGSSRDVMQIFAEREVRAQFRSIDGWKYIHLGSSDAQDMSYVLSRTVFGRNEFAAVGLSFEEVPSEQSLTKAVLSLNGSKNLKSRYLIVPKSADVSGIPETVRVIFMDSFGFVDGNLVWLTKKKNARQYPATQTQQVSETAATAVESRSA